VAQQGSIQGVPSPVTDGFLVLVHLGKRFVAGQVNQGMMSDLMVVGDNPILIFHMMYSIWDTNAGQPLMVCMIDVLEEWQLESTTMSIQ